MPGNERSKAAARLTAAWTLVAQHPTLGSQIRVAAVPDEPETILATLTHQGYRGLLVFPARPESLVIDPALDPSQPCALVAQADGFATEGKALRRGVHIWCRDRSLDDAFAMFCALLCERLQAGTVSAALAECVAEFRRLTSGAQEGVPVDLLGLLGELHWLSCATERDPNAVHAWMGPSGGRHDFRSGLTAVEVKTSLRSASQAPRVHVSALDQMVPPEGGRLFLHLVRLERSEGGDISIGALVERIRARLSPAGIEHFNEQLHHVLGTPATLTGPTFSILETRTYEVRAGFPCLTPDSLIGGVPPLGVVSVSYDIQLDAAGSYQVSGDVAVSAILMEAGNAPHTTV